MYYQVLYQIGEKLTRKLDLLGAAMFLASAGALIFSIYMFHKNFQETEQRPKIIKYQRLRSTTSLHSCPPYSRVRTTIF